MASNKRIKGITIEIGHETTGLEKALSDVNKKSIDLQKELKDVERLLKFDPGNVEALAQKQQLLTKQVENTTEKLSRLKNAEKQVQEQFERGDIGEEQYRNFRREIEFTEGTLGKLKTQLSDMQDEQQKTIKATKELNTLFSATGKSIDDFANKLDTRLIKQIKDGTASSKQLETAIEKVGKASLGTDTDIGKLRDALASVDDGKSIKNVREDLQKLKVDAGEATDSVNDLGGVIEGLAGALAAGGGIAGAIDQAFDMSTLNAKIDVAFDVPEESKATIKEAVRDLEAYGIDGAAALEGVRRQWALNKDVSEESNRAVIEGAAALVSVYEGLDFTELIQENNEIAKALNISNEEALGLTSSLFKMGFPPDQLDIIAEYGTQLQMAGYNAQEVQAIMASGVRTGTWNIDNLLDGLKEGRIIAAEFGQGLDDEMKELLKSTGISSKEFEKWGKAVAGGGQDGSKAMVEIAKSLDGVEDATLKNQLGVKLFGTIFEDQGQNIIDTLVNAQKETVDLNKNQEQLAKTVDKIDSNPAVQLNKAWADLKIALEPLLKVVAEFMTRLAKWIQENPKLVASITAVVTVLGIILGAVMALAPAITAIIMAVSTFGISLGALLGPIGLVIAAIAAIIAIFVTFKDDIIAIWNDHLKPIFDAIVDVIVNALQPAFDAAFQTISTIVMDAFGLIQRLYKEILEPTLMFIIDILEVSLLPAFTVVFETIGSVVEHIFKSIGDLWNNSLKPIFNGIIDFINGTFSGNWEKAWEGVVSIVSGIFGGIVEIIKFPINSIISLINGFIDGLNQIKIPDWVPGVGGMGIDIPTIPKLAKGGKVTGPTFAMVGEGRDDEAVLPLNRNVFNELAKGIVDQMGGGGPQIVIQNMAVRNDNDIKLIARELHNLQQAQKRGLGYR